MKYAARNTHVALSCLLLSACQGHLLVRPILPGAEQEGTYEGIRFYPTALMEEVSQTTIAIEKGHVIATSANPKASGKYCYPVKTSKLIVAADFSHPLLMSYKPGLLEGYTFNPTITEGMLGGVALTSSPDQGKTIANVASIVTDVMKLGAETICKVEPPKGPPPCTDGQVVVARIPHLPTYPPGDASRPIVLKAKPAQVD